MKKLFTEINLSNFDGLALDKALQNDSQLADVTLTIKWSQNRKIFVNQLHLTLDKKKTDILNGVSAIETGSSKTYDLGLFASGTDLEITFSALALMDLPKAIGVIAQTNPTKSYQVEPAQVGQTTKTDSGKKWAFSIKYKVI